MVWISGGCCGVSPISTFRRPRAPRIHHVTAAGDDFQWRGGIEPQRPEPLAQSGNLSTPSLERLVHCHVVGKEARRELSVPVLEQAEDAGARRFGLGPERDRGVEGSGGKDDPQSPGGRLVHSRVGRVGQSHDTETRTEMPTHARSETRQAAGMTDDGAKLFIELDEQAKAVAGGRWYA